MPISDYLLILNFVQWIKLAITFDVVVVVLGRENGKPSLLGVETQRSYLLRDVPGRKDKKVKSRRESILLKNK